MAGPTIIAHGTDAQKQKHLEKILSTEEIWCQGFSEPDAGSDLSAVRTTARRENGHFVVDGQKVWSSFAHIADWCILVTRSDPESQRHTGLTYLLVDMHAPGVEVRPLRQITGEAEFNEIFFTGVEVPEENVVGDVGGGWQVAMTTSCTSAARSASPSPRGSRARSGSWSRSPRTRARRRCSGTRSRASGSASRRSATPTTAR